MHLCDIKPDNGQRMPIASYHECFMNCIFMFNCYCNVTLKQLQISHIVFFPNSIASVSNTQHTSTEFHSTTT